tara:strand:- start:464 stop:976 length:513 start_codon:yes stop_codon:yes gene_type:complete
MGISEMWSTITPKTRGASGGSSGDKRERDELDDGNYKVQVVLFKYWMYDDGKPNPERYKWGLEVVDGLSKGKYVEKYQRCSSIGMQILADDMMLLLGRMPTGEEVYNRQANEAGAVVSAVNGITLMMRQQTSAAGYPNFYFNQVIEDEFAASPDTGSDADDDDDDDDIPF